MAHHGVVSSQPTLQRRMISEVDHPGDYATLNSYQLRDGTAMRFFFDYTAKDQSLYDYRGDEFRNSVAAIDFRDRDRIQFETSA